MNFTYLKSKSISAEPAAMYLELNDAYELLRSEFELTLEDDIQLL
jgi:hypothetical protein